MFSAPEAQAAAGAAVEAAVAVPGAAAAVSAVPRAGRSASAPLPAALEARMQAFQEALSQPRINLKHLKQLAYSGVPDVSGVRSLAWKILLGYLPPQRADWAATLEQKRGQYLQFCRDFACDPASLAAAAESERARAAVADHPLSLEADSAWKRYFQDSEVKEQIDKDVQRTHPDLDFFSGDHPTAVLHRQEMKRALFVYAKLNPGLNYIQGMNELYAPLYYTFSLDLGSARHGSGGSSSGHGGHGDDAVQSGGGSGSLEQQGVGCAEADAFFCFMDLVSECRDHYCKQLDNSSVGIRATLATLQGLLDHHDAEVAEHLRDLQVDVHFFGFRWVALLLTQDFQFPDVMRLWDTLLSDPHGLLDSLLRICVAMVLHLREQLLAADFSTAVKLLQHFPRSTDVSEILRRAHALSAPPHRPSNPLPHRRSTSDNDGTASFTRAGSSGNVI